MAKIDPAQLLAGLSQDKRHGLIELGDRVRAIRDTESGLEAKDNATLVKLIEVYADRHDLKISFPTRDPDEQSWYQHLYAMLNAIESYTIEVHAEDVEKELAEVVDAYGGAESSDLPFGYAALKSIEKEQIHERLTQIRQIVESSNLKESKKNALFSRISKLSAEVDRTGTRTDGFFAFGVDLAMIAGEMAEKAKPAIDEFKDILKIVLNRRAEGEGVKLPKPADYPALPKPDGE